MMNAQMIKQKIVAAGVALFCGLSALAGPQAAYINTGTVTNPPVIDAITFDNEGIFEPVIGLSNVVKGENVDVEAQAPYATRDTLYYTNSPSSAEMIGQPGFLFQTETLNGNHDAISFYNQGLVLGVDAQTAPEFDLISGGTFGYLPGTGFAYPSQISIYATNIFNGANGTIAVGANGLMQVYGQNITNNGIFVAGDMSGNDLYDETSIDQDAYTATYNGSTVGEYFTAPYTMFDLYWGVTASGTLNLGATSPGSPLDSGDTPAEPATGRGAGKGKISLPYTGIGYGYLINTNIVFSGTNFNQFATYVYDYAVGAPTNIYINIVCVETNFIDTNISYQVLFSQEFNDYFDGIYNGTVPDPNGVEDIVQFSVPVYDIVSNQMTSNSLFLVDGGASFSNTVAIYTNSAWPGNSYARPSWYYVSTETPFELDFAFQTNDPVLSPLLEQLIYPGILGTGFYGTNLAKTATYTSASYGVQAGWDPESLGGASPLTEELFSTSPDIPAPSSEPARIDIEGNQVNLTGARIRAEGLVTLMATNLVGSTTGVDWGTANASLGATSGVLLISNVFPQNFYRVRGDLFCWSANWTMVAINSGVVPAVTNDITFHMLVVNDGLNGMFHPTVENLALNGARSIDIEDPLTIINSALFNTASLTIDSAVHFTQNIPSFTGANAPFMENLLINTNGNLMVDNTLDIGYNPNVVQTSPTGRQYTIASVANFGQIEAASPLFQSAFFENDGGITTSNNGSIIIESDVLDMGLIQTNQTNFMKVNGDVTLSAVSIGITNSTIIAGYPNGAIANVPGSLTLVTTPDGQITDFVPNAPTTNNVINNFWQVTGGFNLPVKPATGDLFGTEIQTIATNDTVALHTWAGAGGFSNPVDGFVDNVVIGHLLLSWESTNAVLHFTGAGAQNGLYVDYLDFDQNSLYGPGTNNPSGTNYKRGLVIDTNLTIYFAACDFDDPTKLTSAYPGRLVWVTNFWGPNSTLFVTNQQDTNQACAVNSTLATSIILGATNASAYEFFPPTPNGDNLPYPLNNPTNGAWYFGANPCPSNPLPVESIAPPMGNLSQILSWAQTQVLIPLTVTNLTNEPLAFFKGTYNGLFYDTNGVSVTNTGLLATTNSGFFTMTLAKSGTFSGRLLMGPTTYTFSGAGDSKFSASNGTAVVTARHGQETLTVALQLGAAETAAGTYAQVVGTISNQFWSAPLLADLDAWSSKNESSYAGRYTMLLTNASSTNLTNNVSTNATNIVISATVPAGDSYGTMTVSKLGVVSVTGKLADGHAFDQSVPLSQDGRWPFYAYDAAGKDFVLGWASFQRNLSPSATELYTVGGTNIFWSKGAGSRDAFYTAGFATNGLNLGGFLYVNPGRSDGFVLPDPTNAMVLLEGGGLTLTNAVAYNGKLMYSNQNLTLSFNPAVGSFTGRMINPSGGAPIRMSGVAVQSPDDDGAFVGAFGFFIDEGSGVVILQSQ